ncbi:MAG: hypothetical protein HXX20_23740 [Chloroflexi bacterium]|nr:hypothetical protein [Chloroflexota bacterium]
MSNGSIYDFTIKALPDIIILDSSILLYAVFPSPTAPQEQRLFKQARFFLQRVNQAFQDRTCNSLAPLQAITECFHKITLTAVAPLVQDKADIFNELKRRPELITKAEVPKKLDEFCNKLRAIGIEVVQPSDIPEDESSIRFEVQMVNYIEDLQLLSADAHILTVADRLGIEYVASLDKDFLRIIKEGFSVYTSPLLPIQPGKR